MDDVLSGSPRLLRNLNEKAVLLRLLSEGALTRMELEAFTGLSKPAMSDLLRRLEMVSLIRREGERAGTFGPKAGLWGLEPSCGHVAGVSVGPHAIEVGIADLTGRLLAELTDPRDEAQRYDAGPALLDVLGRAAEAAGLTVRQLDQVVVGLSGIVDSETGHLRKGRQLPDWEGFNIPVALMDVLGHRWVVAENDVNLAAIGENRSGSATAVQSVILLWIGEGVGSGLILGGKLVRGSTGSAGEIGGALVPDRRSGAARPAIAEDLLAPQALAALFGAGDLARVIAAAAGKGGTQAAFLDELAYRIAVTLAGPIGMVDPEMVVLAGEIGIAGGKPLAERVLAILSEWPVSRPEIVPGALRRHAVRAGAIDLALEHARERIFAGGSAARGLP